MTTTDNSELMRDYNREMFRSSVVTAFYAALQSKKHRAGYKAQQLADTLGIHKSSVSRWFSGDLPNWELNTVSDIATALNIDLHFSACDRDSGEVFENTPYHWAASASSKDDETISEIDIEAGSLDQEWMAA